MENSIVFPRVKKNCRCCIFFFFCLLCFVFFFLVLFIPHLFPSPPTTTHPLLLFALLKNSILFCIFGAFGCGRSNTTDQRFPSRALGHTIDVFRIKSKLTKKFINETYVYTFIKTFCKWLFDCLACFVGEKLMCDKINDDPTAVTTFYYI